MKICCVALHAYPVVEPEAEGLFGGTETRAWTFCQGLASQPDVGVSLIVRSKKLNATRMIDGVLIVPKKDQLYWSRQAAIQAISRTPEFPYFSIATWSWLLPFQLAILLTVQLTRRIVGRHPKPNRVYTNSDADVFFAFGVHSESATVIASAKSIGKPVVLFLGADSDVDERFKTDPGFRTRYDERSPICLYTLTQADVVVAQSEWQLKKLRSVFGIDSIVIPNPINPSAWKHAPTPEDEPGVNALTKSKEYVLWIGRADNFHKRAPIMLEIARRMPKIPIVMLMNRRDSEVAERIHKEKPDNLEVIELLPYHLMPKVFSRARVFVNTSSPEYEGFPNVFLQAAAAGVPVVSLAVCEEFLTNSGVGVFADHDVDTAIQQISRLWTDDDYRQPFAESGERYIAKHHDVGSITSTLLERVNQRLS